MMRQPVRPDRVRRVRAPALSQSLPHAVPEPNFEVPNLGASTAARLCARSARQLHGAMGVTAEHPRHQSTCRLLSCCDEHGAEPWWTRVLVLVLALRHAATPGAWHAVVAATSR